MTRLGKAVFLDRDGVLNATVVRGGKPYPPAGPEELAILPGVPEALVRLHRAGYLCIVVTNQPDVARGTLAPETLAAIHDTLTAALPLDAVEVCAHDDPDCCDCRKPLPGMLVRAAQRLELHLPDCVMVGDRWRDIEAGRLAGCRTVFIDYNYTEKRPDPPADCDVPSLAAAVDWIVAAGQGKEAS